VLVVVLAGLGTVSATVTLLGVSLPTIARSLHSDTATLSWSITGPMLAFGVVGPAYGKIGDLWGHKRVFLFGLAGAGVFALATALAPNAGAMIAFRILSASLGAATGPSAMALINRLFAGPERTKALGYWSLTTAGAPVIGVVAGRPLVDAFGWRTIFAVQAPLCLVGLLIAWALLPETDRGRRSRFDVAGAVLLALGVTALLAATNRGAVLGWGHPLVIGAYALAPVALAGFVAAERRAPEPLLPLAWLRRRNVVGPVGAMTLANFAYMGGFILTPLLLQEGLGLSAAAVSLLVIWRPLTLALTAPLASPLTIRIGERRAAVLGALVVAGSMVVLAAVGPGSSKIFIGLGLALSGAGLGVMSPALTSVVASSVPSEDLGVAGAMQQLANQLGAVVGTQVMQSVQVATVASAGLVGSYGNAYVIGAVVCVAGAVVALVIRPSDRTPAAAAAGNLAVSR
jgi:MFS family permease